MKTLKFIVNKIDKIILLIGEYAGIIIMFPMIFATVYDVFLRYFLKSSTIWAYDFTWMSYSTFFLLGAPYCLQKDGHVRVDSFYNLIEERKRALVECLFLLIFFFPFIFLVLKFSIPWAYKSWLTHERSQFTMWRPVVFPAKSMLPLSFILLGLQGVSIFIKNIVFALRGIKL